MEPNLSVAPMTREEGQKAVDPQNFVGRLPFNSPPQALLFSAFYSGFGSAVPDLPALLPEVWLHWDPRTRRERGRDALLRFRVDFLLLLHQGVRIVIGVDGKHHYADAAGRADVVHYA